MSDANDDRPNVALRLVARLRAEINGWLYRHDRDLTGFIDGTENPSLLRAPAVAVIANGPAAGTSIALVQQWRHHCDAWEQLATAEQEWVIGRSEADSVELSGDAVPPTAHVARTVVEEDGVELQIFRRNTAYGTVTDHGMVFVAFSAQQRPFERMPHRMAGIGDGVRNGLIGYTTPLSGAYYLVPAVEGLARAH